MSSEYQLLRERLERLYDELGKALDELHPALARVHRVLGEFLGIPPEVPSPPPERVLVPPTVAPAARIEDILADILRNLKSFDDHIFTIAKNPIRYQGTQHDLGDYYDAAILVPSIDAQIEIDRPVQPETPVIFAQTSFNIKHRVRTIHYKGTSQTLQGTLSIWAFRTTR